MNGTSVKNSANSQGGNVRPNIKKFSRSVHSVKFFSIINESRRALSAYFSLPLISSRGMPLLHHARHIFIEWKVSREADLTHKAYRIICETYLPLSTPPYLYNISYTSLDVYYTCDLTGEC